MRLIFFSGFNSYMVQLEGSKSDAHRELCLCFNSYMVQLEEACDFPS